MNFFKFLFLIIFQRENRLTRVLLLLTVLLGFVSFMIMGFIQIDVLEFLRSQESLLRSWLGKFPLVGILVYFFIYILVVVFCLPGAAFLTLIGGFLFGVPGSIFYVAFSSTIGAYIVFLWVKLSCPRYLRGRINNTPSRMVNGFKKNAFYFLLFLRLAPVFPFWLVNLVPAILGVPGRTYLGATFFGILPGVVIYCYLGSELSEVFSSGQKLELEALVSKELIFLLACLALLSLSPIFLRRLSDKK